MRISHIFTYNIESGKLFNIPDAPVNMMLDITNFCNNKCLYCYNPNHVSYKSDKPFKDELIKIVSLIGESGTKEILYLGGEPFATSMMKDILETGKKYSLFQRAVSNGSFFKDARYCKQLEQKGLKEVGISFHSSDKKIHDQIAGRDGAYDDAIIGLKNCIGAGINTFVQYSPNTLNSKTDIIDLANILDNYFPESVKVYDLNRLIPIGQGRQVKKLILKNSEWYEFLAMATRLFEQGLDVHAELTPFCWISKMAKEYKTHHSVVEKIYRLNRGCFMWVAQLSLDHRGRVKFCPTGEAVGPSILEVEWPKYWKTSKLLNDYRNFIWNSECLDFKKNTACKYFYKCLGGCKYSKGVHYAIDMYSQGMIPVFIGDSSYDG